MIIKLSSAKNDKANFDYASTLKKKGWTQAFYYMLNIHKQQKFSAFDIVESQNKKMWLILYLTCVDMIAQFSLTQ